MSVNSRFNALYGLLLVVGFIFLLSATGMSQDSEYMDEYTGAEADQVGSEVCIACHGDAYPGDNTPTHIALFDADEDCAFYGYGCEACHGPGGNHNGDITGILSFGKMPAEAVTDQCTMCHTEIGEFELDDWADGRHMEAGMSCVDCHSGHSELSSFLNNDNDVEMCSACHADIGEAYEAGTHGVPGSDITCSGCHNPHD